MVMAPNQENHNSLRQSVNLKIPEFGVARRLALQTSDMPHASPPRLHPASRTRPFISIFLLLTTHKRALPRRHIDIVRRVPPLPCEDFPAEYVSAIDPFTQVPLRALVRLCG